MGLLDLLSNILKDPSDEISPVGDALRLAEVEAQLEHVRPALRADGGNIQVVEVTEEGDVHLRMQGACSGCQAQSMTMFQYVEPELKKALPWARHVRLV